MIDDTIKIQARSADEVRATRRVILYKDGCEREFYLPKEEFEWCYDCKEYDREAHCCHRYTKVIRKTIAELRESYTIAKDSETVSYKNGENQF